MTRRENPKPGDRPVVRLKPSNYQPSRAELEEPIRLDTTPEQALKALVTPVRIVRESAQVAAVSPLIEPGVRAEFGHFST